MAQSRFIRDVERGSVGERFVHKHLPELLSQGLILNLQSRVGEHVAGGDATAHFIGLGNTIDDFLPDYIDDPELRNGTAYEITYHTAGAIEIKSDWEFLFRIYDKETPSGTLPFALWSSKTRQNYGWLIRILFPECFYTEGQDIHSVQPMALVYVLAAYQNAFACVAFENIPALKERIISLAKNAGFDLETGVPLGEDAAAWNPEGLIIREAVWYIPLSTLDDLATVTMIGDRPRIRPDIIAGDARCTAATQNQRYDHLVSLSGNRHHLPADVEFLDAFTPSDKMRVFSNIDHNLSVIESINPETYPILFYYSKQKVFRHLKGLMLNMLAHPYPIWPEDNPLFFAIGNNYLENWCKDIGIEGSNKSIQGSLMFLRICGLVIAFRPNKSHQDQVMVNLQNRIRRGDAPRALTYRTVPFYTDQVLHDAELMAKRFYDRKIIIAKLSKTDVISVLGQEEADKLYLSGFKVSETENYVDNVFFSIMLADVQQQGYTLFDSVKQRVWETIRSECGFKFIDPFSVQTEEERLEMERQRQYSNAVKKFEERKSAKATNIGLIYRQISKVDRERLNIPPEIKCWFFVPA